MEQVASAIPESTEEKFTFSFMLSFTPEMVTPGSLIIDLYQDGLTAPALLLPPEGQEVPYETTEEVNEFLGSLGLNTAWEIASLFRVNKVKTVDGTIIWEYGDLKYSPHLEDGFVSDYQGFMESEILGVKVHRQDRHCTVVRDTVKGGPEVPVFLVTEDMPVKDGDTVIVVFNKTTNKDYIFNVYNTDRAKDEDFMYTLTASLWVLVEQGMSDFSFIAGKFIFKPTTEIEIDEGYVGGAIVEPDGEEHDFQLPEEHYLKQVH